MSDSGGDDLLEQIAAVAARHPSPLIGVAVSGGGDSTALLHLLAQSGRRTGTAIIAATIDHGLRAASAEEAEAVARACGALAVQHTILGWSGWDGSGNLQDAARSARYRLLGDWARANACAQVWLGHTADDQAETFLLRLARGSGVDGLSAMPEATKRDGIDWIRPLLAVSRERLRRFLTGERIHWIDDPSNADPRFDRIRFRNAADSLADLGLTRERLNATAANMARARAALERMTDGLQAAASVANAAGEVLLDPAAFAQADAEIRLRLLARVLNWVSGAIYRPRLEALEQLDRSLSDDALAGGVTLHGCVLRSERGKFVVRREIARVSGPVPAGRRIWDGRWKVDGPVEGLMLGALGESGLEQAKDWRLSKVSREALLTTPALWRGDELVAAPLAGMEAGVSAGFVRAFTEFGYRR